MQGDKIGISLYVACWMNKCCSNNVPQFWAGLNYVWLYLKKMPWMKLKHSVMSGSLNTKVR